MSDKRKTKAQLIEELTGLRQRVTELESSYTRIEESLQALLNANPEMTFLMDVEGTILVANRKFAQHYGTTCEKLIGSDAYDLIPLDIRRQRKSQIARVIASGQPVQFEDESDGRQYINFIYPVLDNQGQVIRLAVYIRDITEQRKAGQALQESEANLSALINNTQDFIWLLDRDLRLVTMNSAFKERVEQIFGTPPEPGHRILNSEAKACISRSGRICHSEARSNEESLAQPDRRPFASAEGDVSDASPGSWNTPEAKRGEGLIDRLSPKIVEDWHTLLARALRGEQFTVERHYELAPNLNFDLEISFNPIRSAEGQVRGVGIFSRNINERRKAQEKLEQSVALLRATLEATGDGIVVVNKDLEVVEYNRRFYEVWELPIDWTEIPFVDERQALMSERVKDPETMCKRTREMYSDPIAKGHELLEMVDGRVFEVHSQPYYIDSEVGGRVWSFRDVTERRHAEEELRTSEARYRTLFENAADAVFLVDPDGTILEANRTTCEQTGYTREELLQMTPADLDALDDEVLMQHRIEQILEKKQLIFETIHLGKDGHEIPVEVNARLIEHEGRQVILTIARNLSERKTLEEQLQQSQKMEAVGQLAGGVAHDFNNILTAISGHTDFLLEDLDIKDPRRRDAEGIQQATQRAAALTRQLLTFSRRQMLQFRILNLNDIIANLSRMLHRLIGEDIELISVLNPDPPMVKVDPGQIEQVILNLVVNAREAMPQGGTIVIETEEVSLQEEQSSIYGSIPPGNYVKLSVTDTGTGIDEETRSHIFEPFYTTKEKGTGLGLSIVYGIVSQSNGHITIDSRPGRDTVFTIYLPAIRNEKGTGEPRMSSVKKSAQGTETVLVVEDSDQVRKLACRILQSGGYEVLAAGYGEEALRLCREYESPIHLLITDIVMPGGMSGRELAEKLSERRPEMLVIFMSGHTDDAIIRHGIWESGADFLPKPFSAAGLLQMARRVLDGEDKKETEG